MGKAVSVSVIILLIMALAIGFIAGTEYEKQKIKTENTVEITNKIGTESFDSVYVSALERNADDVSKLYLHEKRLSRKLLAKIRKLYAEKQQTVAPALRIDTVFIRGETPAPVYSAPFRIGGDTLNCTGIAAFDMRRFYFEKVRFRYPEKVITRTVFVERTNWTYTAVAALGGVIAGILITK